MNFYAFTLIRIVRFQVSCGDAGKNPDSMQGHLDVELIELDRENTDSHVKKKVYRFHVWDFTYRDVI